MTPTGMLPRRLQDVMFPWPSTSTLIKIHSILARFLIWDKIGNIQVSLISLISC